MITIVEMEKMEELKRDNKSATDIIDEGKTDICNNYCKYAEACDAVINNGGTVYCPLNRL